MIHFSLFGIPVRVEPLFWLTIAILGGGLSATNADALLGVALFVLAAFISVLIHEFGHALMIKKYGLKTEVVLTTLGGYASYPPGILTRQKSFLVTAAGPAVQLVFGLLVLYGIKSQIAMPSAHLSWFVTVLIWVSLVWAIFNCLPIYPLDGGQMLAAILGPERAKGLHMTGMITAVIVGLLALSFKQIFVTLFMGMFVYQNYQLYKNSR